MTLKRKKLSRTCDAPHNLSILVMLWNVTGCGSGSGSAKFQSPQKKSCEPISPFQKGWQTLVHKGRPHHRALATEDGPDFIWVWIGSHDEYERLIKQQG
jgi:hypothetical protein